jgi:hypothetical protein
MTDKKRVVTAIGSGVDQKTRDVIVGFKTDDRSDFELRIAPEIVGAVAITLFGLAKNISISDDDGVSAQVMVLAGAIPIRGPQRQPGLDLVFANGMHVPVVFSEEVTQILRRAIASLDHTSIDKEPPSQTRN